MPVTPTIALSHVFQASARVTRSQLYGASIDAQMPRHLQQDAKVPFLGFVGAGFSPGRPVLLAINPGGGGDAYTTRTPQDAELIPLLQAFVQAEGSEVATTFERMCSNYARQVGTWNLWRILHPTLQACRCTLDEVCYLNVFPYRTAKDARPSQSALQASWNLVIQPLLAELKPSMLIALGKKAGDVAARYHQGPPRLFVVPRTIGDTRVSPEARQVLDAIQARAA